MREPGGNTSRRDRDLYRSFSRQHRPKRFALVDLSCWFSDNYGSSEGSPSIAW